MASLPVPAIGTETRIPYYHKEKEKALVAELLLRTTSAVFSARPEQLVYEWCQTLEELLLFIKLPVVQNRPASKNDLDIRITPRNLYVGLNNQSPYLNDNLWSAVDADESTWYIDESEIRIECTKALKGETWEAAFAGHGQLDPFSQQTVRKQMMLERFQEEHPGFDFSQAQFSGQAPDPRTFLGGVPHR